MAVPRFKQKPTDVWSVRERLALACSVMRSGDQNWVSVSRAIKPYGELHRPNDWFSQKNCALQYADLLEKVETPKRKRADRAETETPGAQIARKLTIERIEELKQMVKEEQQKYKKLKLDLEACKAGQNDDNIKQTWEELLAERKMREEAAEATVQQAKEENEARAAALAARVPGKPVAVPHKKKNTQGLRLTIRVTSEDESTQDSVMGEEPLPIKVEEESCSNLSMGSFLTSQNEGSETQPSGSDVKQEDNATQALIDSSQELKKAISESQQHQAEEEMEQDRQEAAAMETEVGVKLEQEDSQPELSITQEEENSNKSGKSEESSTDTVVYVKEETPPVEGASKGPSETPKVARSSEGPPAPITSSTPSSPAVGAPTLSRLLVTPPIITPVSSIKQVTQKIPAPSQEEKPVERRVSTGGGKTHTMRTREKSESSERDEQSNQSGTPHTGGKVPHTGGKGPHTGGKGPHTGGKGPHTGGKGPHAAKQHTGGKGPLLSMQPDIEDPASPASSVISNETDSGSAKTNKSSSRSSRGKGRTSMRRSSGRLRGRTQDGKDEDGETSDEEMNKEEGDDLPMTPRAHTLSESIPNSPAQSFSSDTEDEKAHRAWKKSIMLVWRAAANHKYANVFLHPVTDDIAPGYSSVVNRPMDLLSIKRNIEMGVTRSTAEFQRDVMLMFTNAIMYNNSDHDVYNMALDMYDDVLNHIEQFVNTQMMVSAEQKVLRPSRRSEVTTSDKEDEGKKRKVVEAETGGKTKKRK